MIGLTGGIGSGKSAVASIWRECGATIIDADQVARDVVAPGMPALQELLGSFGEDILLETGHLNRPLLAQRAFSSADTTAQLNAIMGHHIAARTEELCLQAENPHQVVYDAPLLIEHNLDDHCSLLVVVMAEEARRRQRLREFRGLADDDIDRRISHQVTDEVRRARADLIIPNNGTLDELREASYRAWDEVCKRSSI